MLDSRKQQPAKALRPLVEGLERRMLYSADAAALGLEAPTSPIDDDAMQVETQLVEQINHDGKLDAIDAAGEEFHLVVIDADLEDADVLREAAEQGGAEVLLFHSEDETAEDVLKRISGVAAERGEDFDSISIVSHGSGGQFDLGSDLITRAEAEGSLDLWQEVGSHLSADANLYLYGCNVVDGSGEGQALLDTLAEATGADVFASSDLSGAGGDWDLEAASSGDEAEAAAGLVTPIDASVVESMSSALVDYNETNWNGTQVFNDGAISFTLTYQQGGSIDWHYDGATNTLTVTDLNGGGPNADFVIIDHNGGLIVDEISIENFRGSLTSDVDIGTLNLGLGNPTSLIVGGGSGTVGTINLTGPVDDSGTIQANVGTIDITGGGIDDGTTIRVEGDVGDIRVDGDVGVGASLEVTGDLPTLDVTGTVNGQIDIDGDMTSVVVGGDLNGTMNVGGDLPTLTVLGGGDATIVVGGDLDTADWSGDFVGTLTVTNTVGHIDIVDDGINEYSNDLTPPTLVFYDGSANHGTPSPNNAPTADPLNIVLSEDGTAVVSLTGSDIDAGDAIETFRVESLPANGTLYLGTTALVGPTDIPAAQIAANQLTFVPDPDWNGATSFAFSTHDGDDGSVATALVSITVDPANDAPTADPLNIVLSEDGTAVVSLTGSDIDAGDAIETFRVESLPANGTLYLGTTALVGPTDIPAAQIAANQLTFVPDPDWNGATSFAFSTHDGDDGSVATALVSITVDPANDAPTADPLNIVLSEDGTAVVSLTGSDIDAGDAIETFRVESLPANGTLYLGTTALVGPTDIPAAQIAANQLTFVPDPDWNGATSFAFSTHDGDDGSATTALVSITVDPVPELPIDDVPDPDPEPDSDPEPEPEVEFDPDDTDSEDLAGDSAPGGDNDATALPDTVASYGQSIADGGISSVLSDSLSSDAEGDSEGETARPETDFGLDESETNDHPTAAAKDNGPVFAVRRLELDVPPVGYVESEVSRQILEQIEKDEIRVSGFEAASVALSATVVALMSRSASLVAMAVSSIPAWHRFDPLAVVAMSEGSRRAWAQQQKDAESDEDVDDERLKDMLGD